VLPDADDDTLDAAEEEEDARDAERGGVEDVG
jgi:hypothetical protein